MPSLSNAFIRDFGQVPNFNPEAQDELARTAATNQLLLGLGRTASGERLGMADIDQRDRAMNSADQLARYQWGNASANANLRADSEAKRIQAQRDMAKMADELARYQWGNASANAKLADDANAQNSFLNFLASKQANETARDLAEKQLFANLLPLGMAQAPNPEDVEWARTENRALQAQADDLNSKLREMAEPYWWNLVGKNTVESRTKKANANGLLQQGTAAGLKFDPALGYFVAPQRQVTGRPGVPGMADTILQRFGLNLGSPSPAPVGGTQPPPPPAAPAPAPAYDINRFLNPIQENGTSSMRTPSGRPMTAISGGAPAGAKVYGPAPAPNFVPTAPAAEAPAPSMAGLNAAQIEFLRSLPEDQRRAILDDPDALALAKTPLRAGRAPVFMDAAIPNLQISSVRPPSTLERIWSRISPLRQVPNNSAPTQLWPQNAPLDFR